jgi:sulfofructose kinase
VTSPDGASPSAPPPVVCAGLAVIDYVFAIERPTWGSKQRATAFNTVVGGCAANATVTVARRGARSRLVAPLGGPEGSDAIGDQILGWLAREKVDCSRVVRMPGVTSPLSSILIDRAGERSIVSYRDPRFRPVPPEDADALIADAAAVLVDDHLPEFVLPVAAAARKRGIPVVVDLEKSNPETEKLHAVCSHLVFSAEGARATAGTDRLELAVRRIAKQTQAFVAATNGGDDMLFSEGGEPQRLPAFAIKAVDTLAAGDVFHGAFALALAERRGIRDALRFASAVAALKCTRFGGIAGAPTRAEVEQFLKEHAAV